MFMGVHPHGKCFCSLNKQVERYMQVRTLGISRPKWAWHLETGRDKGTWYLEANSSREISRDFEKAGNRHRRIWPWLLSLCFSVKRLSLNRKRSLSLTIENVGDLYCLSDNLPSAYSLGNNCLSTGMAPAAMSVMPLPHYFPDYSDGVGETRLGQPYFLSTEFGIGSGALIQSLCMEGGGAMGQLHSHSAGESCFPEKNRAELQKEVGLKREKTSAEFLPRGFSGPGSYRS